MKPALLIGLGGALGALARYYLASLISTRFAQVALRFPLGIACVNLLGCLLIGLVTGLLLSKTFAPSWGLFAIVGFLGAFTTFSTFSVDNLMLLQKGRWLWLGLNAFGQLGLGLCLVFIGMGLAKLLS